MCFLSLASEVDWFSQRSHLRLLDVGRPQVEGGRLYLTIHVVSLQTQDIVCFLNSAPEEIKFSHQSQSIEVHLIWGETGGAAIPHPAL